jgi:hypothetical protein
MDDYILLSSLAGMQAHVSLNAGELSESRRVLLQVGLGSTRFSVQWMLSEEFKAVYERWVQYVHS